MAEVPANCLDCARNMGGQCFGLTQFQSECSFRDTNLLRVAGHLGRAAAHCLTIGAPKKARENLELAQRLRERHQADAAYQEMQARGA